MAEGIAISDDKQELTDGFNLIIDAMKLNGVKTIYGVPGIPITDFGRMVQASGIRVLSFRHEQNAGYAAAIAGLLTKKPGICLTVSAPGFLNGLTALAHATTNCFPMILISGSSEREIVDLQQGDYSKPIVRTVELSTEELIQCRRKALLTFYLRPSYIVRTLLGVRSPKVLGNYIKSGLRLLKAHAFTSSGTA